MLSQISYGQACSTLLLSLVAKFVMHISSHHPTVQQVGCQQPPLCFAKSGNKCSSLWSLSGLQMQAGFLHMLTSHLPSLALSTTVSAHRGLATGRERLQQRHTEGSRQAVRGLQGSCPGSSRVGLLTEPSMQGGRIHMPLSPSFAHCSPCCSPPRNHVLLTQNSGQGERKTGACHCAPPSWGSCQSLTHILSLSFIEKNNRPERVLLSCVALGVTRQR